jgi:hypothetical protein
MMTKFLTALALLATVTAANAQGIYMLNGRATPQVIVDPYGRPWPVIPGPQFAGPSPIILAPPLPPAPLPLPPVISPPVPTAVPPPPPLGWLFGRYLACYADTGCSVATDVHGLNVRAVPNGPIVLALANGTPVIPLSRAGNWVLVAPACNLIPTFTWSITAGGLPLSVCSFD